MKNWTDFGVGILGAWLIGSGFYETPRNFVLFWSGVGSGGLLLFLSGMVWFLERKANDSTAFVIRRIRWTMGGVGLWLITAPILFWAPTAFLYSNDTWVGLLVIALSVVGSTVQDDRGSSVKVPPGWRHNPSSWHHRLPILTLAFLGFLIARYLAAYQLSHIQTAWDPFFEDGTETILKSDVSKAFPVSDAGLGAWSYLLDAIAGAIGNTRRWHTMPWIVIFFGLMIIPPGVTSIVLVILQPAAVGSWCTLCLAAAVVMLIMVSPVMDEVIATFQFLRSCQKQGRPLWRCLWKGDTDFVEKGMPQENEKIGEDVDGVHWTPFKSFSWNLGMCVFLGVGIMMVPSLADLSENAALFYYVLGAWVVTFAVIALAQVARPVRLLNCVLGVVLALGVWVVPGVSLDVRGISTVLGVLLTALSFPLGKIYKNYGNYDRWARWEPFKRLK